MELWLFAVEDTQSHAFCSLIVYIIFLNTFQDLELCNQDQGCALLRPHTRTAEEAVFYYFFFTDCLFWLGFFFYFALHSCSQSDHHRNEDKLLFFSPFNPSFLPNRYCLLKPAPLQKKTPLFFKKNVFEPYDDVAHHFIWRSRRDKAL